MRTVLNNTIGAALAVMFLSLGLSASDTVRDGNWWVNLTTHDQATYMTGFFDGTHLGHDASVCNFAHTRGTKPCVSDRTDSFDTFQQTYTRNPTNIQIADGLSAFYSDYRNRSVVLHDAVWLVLNGIAGMQPEKLEKMIENFRRSAARDER